MDKNYLYGNKFIIREGDKMALKAEDVQFCVKKYGAQNICFFLYDREKIIENPLNFKMSYEAKMKEKKIHIIIHQSKIL